MKTIKKYLDSSYTHKFNAIIRDVITCDTCYKIILDETFFYPLGGGQPADKGFIGDYEIFDVQHENEAISHYTKSVVDTQLIGQAIACEVDFSRRHQLMQHHTGQHLLSACAYKKWHANTFGMHLSENYVTVDLDKKLTKEEIQELETTCNQLIFDSLLIKTHTPTPSELNKLPLRKPSKVEEDVRVIEIDTLDFSPCGGTHLNTTSEIGLLKILKFENYKSGIRIEFVCGKSALEHFRHYHETVFQLMHLFSVQSHEVLETVQTQLEALKRERLEKQAIEKEWLQQQVKEILLKSPTINDIKYIELLEDHTPMNKLREKVQLITSLEPCLVIAGAYDGQKSHLVLGKSNGVFSKLELHQTFKKIAPKFGLRGGGNASMAQGGSDGTLNFNEIFSKIKNEVTEI